MAHALSLTDGTTTINLADGSTCFVERYTPKTPDVTTGAAVRTATYGEEIGAPLYRNVTESADLFLRATSVAALQALVRSIEAMLEKAHRRQRLRSGARVYLVVQVDGEASAWRSEIVSGRLVLAEDALRWWPGKAVEAQLIIQRRPYFEGAEVELELSTSNQAAATGGCTIVNHDDSGAGDDNWVQIAAAQVGGALPAPVRLSIQNTSGATRYFSNFYVSTLANMDVTGVSLILEGENQHNPNPVSDGNSSNGQYTSYSYTNTTGSAVSLVFPRPFTVGATLMQKMAGRWVRCLARFVSLSAPMYCSIYVQDASNAVLWWGPETLIQTTASDLRLRDLGAVPLPPLDLGNNASAVTLVFQLRITVPNGATMTAHLDYVQLTPMEFMRVLGCNDAPLVNNAALIIDEIEGLAYSETTGERLAMAVRGGSTVMVVPGQTQRIVVLCDEGSPSKTSVIGRSFAVRAWYRPRRLTV